MRKALLHLPACLLIILSLFSCAHMHSNQSVSVDFENRCFGRLDFDIDKNAKEYAITNVFDPIRNNNRVVRFEVREDDIWCEDAGRQVNRAELSEWDRYFAPFNVDLWYHFRLYIPDYWPDGENRCVIAQCHGVPDEGEQLRNPVLKLEYRAKRFEFKLFYDAEKINDDAKKIGCVKYKIKKLPVQKNTWYTFIINAKWSYTDAGYVNVWIDNRKVIDYKNKPVGYNDECGPFFKMGIYRDKICETAIIFFDDFRRGKSYSEIGIADPFASTDETYLEKYEDCSMREKEVF